jgi:hypothetical protein
MRIVDTLIVFRILKMLTTPFDKTQAYKLGYIDKKGTRIKYKPDPKNPAVKLENKPFTSTEKASLTPLHRLVFNLKKIIEKLPFGKSQFASYAVALALLKEEARITEDQADELCEKFYRHLKENELVTSESIQETINLAELQIGNTYHTRLPVLQNDTRYPHKTPIQIVAEHSIVYGIPVYIAFIQEHRVLVTADDVY